MPDSYHKLGIKIRKSILDMVGKADRGHIPSAFSIVEILLVLYGKVLRLDPLRVNHVERDRMLLSKGHGCLALYSVLAEYGFFNKSELDTFCQYDSILGGHPEHHCISGVEASTGALGHGLSIAIGMAISARIDGLDFNCYVILGDGECNEGSIWEAALSASKHKLNNLVVLVDYNKLQSYGKVSEIMPLEPFANKWEAFGFETQEVDMTEPLQLESILLEHRENKDSHQKPVAIICHTTKGYGVKSLENNAAAHHKARFKPGEIEQLKAELEVKV